MKKLGMLLAAVAAVGLFASVAIAKDKKEKKEKKESSLSGKIVKVKANNIIVKSGKNEVTLETDGKTEVTIDGEKATVEDLKEGMHVKVMPATGVARKIAATTKDEKKDKKGGKDKKDKEDDEK